MWMSIMKYSSVYLGCYDMPMATLGHVTMVAMATLGQVTGLGQVTMVFPLRSK